MQKMPRHAGCGISSELLPSLAQPGLSHQTHPPPPTNARTLLLDYRVWCDAKSGETAAVTAEGALPTFLQEGGGGKRGIYCGATFRVLFL